MDDTQYLHHQGGHLASQVRAHVKLCSDHHVPWRHLVILLMCSSTSVCAQFDWWICIRRLDEDTKQDENLEIPGMPKTDY